MAQDTLQKQFKALLRRNQGKANEALVKVTEMMTSKWIHELIDQSYGYMDVTGNVITGYFVGAYIPVNGKMRLVSASFSGDIFEPPTRLWLKEDEEYNLPTYYSGFPVDEDHPFVGFIGDRNEYSQKEAIRFLKGHSPRKAPIAFLVGVATDYASYLETRNKTNLIGDFCEDKKSKGWIVKMYVSDAC